MSLLEELHVRRDRAEKRAVHHQDCLTKAWNEVAECDTAISALTPPLQHKGGETEADPLGAAVRAIREMPDEVRPIALAALDAVLAGGPPSTDLQPDHLAEFMKLDGAVKWDYDADAPFVCPVSVGVKIEYLRRDGGQRLWLVDEGGAKETWWCSDGVPSDILAYRILSHPKTAEPPISTLQASSGEGEFDPDETMYPKDYIQSEQERVADGWVPVSEFRFPKAEAIVEARWSDGYCETLQFSGYTPTTNEPEWRTNRDKGAAEAEIGVTHYRSFPAERNDLEDLVLEHCVSLSDYLTRDGAVSWSSGEMPVARDTVVEILTRDGRVLRAEALCYAWTPIFEDRESYSDIIAYRVVEPAAEPAAYSPVNNADEPVTKPEADVFYHGLQAEAEAKKDPVSKLFGAGGLFGKPKALVGEGT